MWIILFVGGSEIAAGRMQVADFFTFAMYVYELTFPTFIMGWVFALVQRGAAAMQRIDEVLAVQPSIADRPDAVPVARCAARSSSASLTFRYAGVGARAGAARRLAARAGRARARRGRPVGAGKTTLASLIPRLYEVPDGRSSSTAST